jgi:hypothetical protein
VTDAAHRPTEPNVTAWDCRPLSASEPHGRTDRSAWAGGRIVPGLSRG